MSESSICSTRFVGLSFIGDPSEARVVSRHLSSLLVSKSIECCCLNTRVPAIAPSDLVLSVVLVPLDVGILSSIVVEAVGAISKPVLNLGSTVSSRMNGSPAPRARRTAGMITVELHTVIDTAASTPPEKEEGGCTVSWGFGSARSMKRGTAVPKIASQTPGLTITKTACTTDDIVVAIDMEKIKNKRKRKAGTLTPLET